MRLTIHDLRKAAAERKLAMLTCYDAGFARVLDAAGVDMILIGDSLGMVVQGHDSTLPVTLEQIIYHTQCVARGATRAWLVADMPFGSYQVNRERAFEHAVALMQAGAQMVKLEGGEEMADTVRFLVERGVPVCAHIGLTPQHVNVFGGYRVQGKSDAGAVRLESAAQTLAAAGAGMLVLEAIPEAVARRIAQKRLMLTIGIGASGACDGQVLVLHDLLGVSGIGEGGLPSKRPRFVKDFLRGHDTIESAVRAYVSDVQTGRFPAAEHVY